MRILFLTPNSTGTGEAITAMHAGADLARSGHEVRYFADKFTSGMLRSRFAGMVDELSDDPCETRSRWYRLFRSYRPHVVIFADYPLLFLSRRGRALLEVFQSIETLDAELVTLDHLGMAQGPLTLCFGPAHLEPFPEYLPMLPERMKTLLPCPLQSPMPVPERRGVPFRYWDPPLGIAEDTRAQVRKRFLRRQDELMVFHSVPTWAQEFCRRHRLPNHSFLPRLFGGFFGQLPQAVTVVSVNGGSMPAPSSASGFRVVDLGRLGPGEYDELLFASDLMITDNRISVSLGKAVCGSIPCATLRNSYRLAELVERAEEPVKALLLEMERVRLGSVFPFEVFPIWSREDLEALRIFRANPIEECVVNLELYGGEETRQAFRELLTGAACRQKLQLRQQEYASSIRRLPGPEEALRSVLG